MPVTATDTQTNATRTAVTDQSGRYVFSDLKDGLYRVEAELKGFKKFSRDAVEVKAGAPVRVDVVLEVGGLSEEIVVSDVRDGRRGRPGDQAAAATSSSTRSWPRTSASCPTTAWRRPSPA